MDKASNCPFRTLSLLWQPRLLVYMYRLHSGHAITCEVHDDSLVWGRRIMKLRSLCSKPDWLFVRRFWITTYYRPPPENICILWVILVTGYGVVIWCCGYTGCPYDLVCVRWDKDTNIYVHLLLNWCNDNGGGVINGIKLGFSKKAYLFDIRFFKNCYWCCCCILMTSVMW